MILSSSSDSDDSSDTSLSGSQSEEESGADEDSIEWLLSQGKKGHLHLLATDNTSDGWLTRCNRQLVSPEYGLGISQAATTDHMWSPRCFAKLPPILQKWWMQHRTQSSSSDTPVRDEDQGDLEVVNSSPESDPCLVISQDVDMSLDDEL